MLSLAIYIYTGRFYILPTLDSIYSSSAIRSCNISCQITKVSFFSWCVSIWFQEFLVSSLATRHHPSLSHLPPLFTCQEISVLISFLIKIRSFRNCLLSCIIKKLSENSSSEVEENLVLWKQMSYCHAVIQCMQTVRQCSSVWLQIVILIYKIMIFSVMMFPSLTLFTSQCWLQSSSECCGGRSPGETECQCRMYHGFQGSSTYRYSIQVSLFNTKAGDMQYSS